MMNSYFEQGGFYGQTAGTAATASPADQAAYRFPLGLGMGVNPYSQHNAAAAAAAARPQDSAYAAAAAAAAEIAASGGVGQTSPKSNSLYSPLSDSSSYKAPNAGAAGAPAPPPANNSAASTGSSNNSVSSAGLAGSTNDCKDQNGYSSLSKDVNSANNSTSLNSQSSSAPSWSGGGGGAGGGGGNHVTPPPRPSADTPDHMSRYTPTAADVAARERWMNTCSLTQSAAAAQQQMHAQASSANHTFYPWMAIAGKATSMYHRGISRPSRPLLSGRREGGRDDHFCHHLPVVASVVVVEGGPPHRSLFILNIPQVLLRKRETCSLLESPSQAARSVAS